MVKIILILIISSAACIAQPPGWTTKASYYGEAYRGKPTANWREGWIFNPDEWTCASWDYNFGDVLLITHGKKQVIVIVTDRGPAMKYWYMDIKIDLSEASFNVIKGDSKEGRLNIYVELIPEVEVEVSYE